MRHLSGLARLRAAWLLPAVLIGGGAHVRAQANQPAWEVEAHGGSMTSSTPQQGTFALPGLSAAIPPNLQRPVSSWFFGDGAQQVNAFAGVRLGGNTTLAPLDGALQRQLITRDNGAAFGVRVSRRLTPRLSAELTVDSGLGELALTDEARSALEASRASFINAFNALFSGGFYAARTVDATLALSEDGGSQIMTTGAVLFDILPASRWTPYVTGGLGGVANTGDAPQAVLTGTYQVLISVPGLPIPPSTFSQTDQLTVTSTVEPGVLWVVGGGVKFAMAGRWNIRFDVRDYMHGNTIRTVISAAPTLPLSSFGVLTTSVFGSPPLVFSGTSFVQSTLSVPLNDFETFSSSGVSHNFTMTTGVSWRF